MTLSVKTTLLLSSSASLLLGLGGTAMSQTAAPAGSGTTALPKIEVIAPRRAQPPRRPQTRVTTGQRRETPAAPPPPTEAQVVAGKNDKFNEARQNIVAPIGATFEDGYYCAEIVDAILRATAERRAVPIAYRRL